MSTFDDFGLDPRIADAVSALGFETPTPIQEGAIPVLMAGRDVIGSARTGSGKTAAFGLPLMERVKEGGPGVRALVLAPTRELAMQVAEALNTFGAGVPARLLAIYGGAPYGPQLKALKRGVSVVVGTPGRVIDHMERGTLDLSGVEMLVLDEADEMLRMGFIDAVEQVMASLPESRQIALFSATMPLPIQRIAERFLVDPLSLPVEDDGVEHIEQCYLRVPQRKKLAALVRVLLGTARGTTLVFARTRSGCAEVAAALAAKGIAADAIHGDLSQPARQRVIARLKAKRLRVLVATDVAARGIDISHIGHVINLDLPGDLETYVHRIGRTARAGAEGSAISFVTPGERRRLQTMQKRLKVTMTEVFAPGDAVLEGIRREEIWGELQGHLEPDQDVRAWLQALVTSEGVTAEDVAAAALSCLSGRGGRRLEAVPEPRVKDAPERPERRAQERPGRDPEKTLPSDDERQLLNEVEVFLSVGRSAGVEVGDIVGAITHEAGVPGSRIGRVSLFDYKCFVGVPKDVAEHLITKHPVLVIRGRSANVALSRGRGPYKGGSRPPSATGPRPPKRGGAPSGPRQGGGPSKAKRPTFKHERRGPGSKHRGRGRK